MASKYSSNDGRHFKNKFEDFERLDSTNNAFQDGKIDSSMKDFLVKNINYLFEKLKNEIPNLNPKDASIYTGLSGISYFFWFLSQNKVQQLANLNDEANTLSLQLLKSCLRHMHFRPGSFICDSAGPLIMSVLLGNEANVAIKEIINMLGYVLENKDIPNEMLYGRSGYLFGILLLRKHNHDEISDEIIKKVFCAIIKSGRDLSRIKSKQNKNIPPLYYEWHGKAYLGGAHGIAGIIFMLLQVYLDPKLSNSIREELKTDIMQYVKPTLDYLCTLRLPSGNYPSSLGDSVKKDVLVHWCHGAPGWIYMFLAAHEIFQEPLYWDRAKEICDVIWSRGLLEKGCGLCHGSAGNGYAFLAAYNHSGEEKYLYMALKFAEWCTDCFGKRTREADRPYSLFEGLSGTLYFLVDCLDPKNAKFPCFQL